MRYGLALPGLALALAMTTAACANSGKSGAASDEGGTIYPGGDEDTSGDATVSPPTGPEHPANEADEGAPPIPPDATPAAVDAGTG